MCCGGAADERGSEGRCAGGRQTDAVIDSLDVVLLAVGAAAWCTAVVTALFLARKRRADISLLRLWFDGARWYRRDTFRPEGMRLWRLFVGAGVVSATCLVIVGLRTVLR